MGALPQFLQNPLFAGKATGPRVDPETLTIGIVHFGIGAFHRAHQAVFTEDAAAATGDTRWGILGVTGRTDSVVRQLQPQDCLYGVLQKGEGKPFKLTYLPKAVIGDAYKAVEARLLVAFVQSEAMLDEANRPESAAIGTPAPGCALPPAR